VEVENGRREKLWLDRKNRKTLNEYKRHTKKKRLLIQCTFAPPSSLITTFSEINKENGEGSIR